MSDTNPEISRVNIEDELRKSYLDYAMSVIVSRALPDVRDGLKPVHRRVLYAMNELNNYWNRSYKKSARIVGDVIGRYHPHGDTAVYDTMVRMAQPFSLRYPLVNGQGNFGSLDGDTPAAMRYTEVRMERLAHDLMFDLDKETVNFSPNYDGNELIPDVLPTRVPNLLINGSSGIAVGMATNIPPHNMGEILDATLALIDSPGLSADELMRYVQGPDFPTGGLINGRIGIVQAYRTGRGRAVMRARTEIEVTDKGRERILVTEVPYQINKARMIERIAELVRNKELDGIREIRDESDKDGVRVVIDIRQGVMAELVLRHLFKKSSLQSTFGINCVALVNGRPQTLNLPQMLNAFIAHRREVIFRRSIYLLRRARARGHVLEGLAVAISNLDELLGLIRAAQSPDEARAQLCVRGWEPGLMDELLQQQGSDADEETTSLCRPDDLDEAFGIRGRAYWLSSVQARAILDLRLHRLTAMERDKLAEEYRGVIEEIGELIQILEDPDELTGLMKEELQAMRSQYADGRRTEILDAEEDYEEEDLIERENLVVTVSHSGYAKTQGLDIYQAQRRGGMGKTATAVREEDFVEHLLISHSHSTLLCFTDLGRVFWLRVFRIPRASRTSRGLPLVNLLALEKRERVTSILTVDDFNLPLSVVMATRHGIIKKTALEQFSRPRSVGLIAIKLDDGDRLVGTALTDGNADVMLFSDVGKVVRFRESKVRQMGRVTRGVRGMRLGEGEQMIALLVPRLGSTILTLTRNGFGKRTKEQEFPVKGRAIGGVIAIRVSDRNGALVGAVQVNGGDEVMLISDSGRLIRTRVSEISTLGRNTQGVTVVRLREGEALAALVRIAEGMDGSDENGGDSGGTTGDASGIPETVAEQSSPASEDELRDD